MAERVRASLRKDTITAKFLQQLVDNGHQSDMVTAFRAILATPRINTKEMCKRFLMTAESVDVRLFKTELRHLVSLLLLPWPRK